MADSLSGVDVYYQQLQLIHLKGYKVENKQDFIKHAVIFGCRVGVQDVQ